MGEHVGAVVKSLKRRPCIANLSSVGVSISPPNAPRSLMPRSSAAISRKLGRTVLSLATVCESIRNGAAEIDRHIKTRAAEQARQAIIATRSRMLLIQAYSNAPAEGLKNYNLPSHQMFLAA